jgi:hypothetical protein
MSEGRETGSGAQGAGPDRAGAGKPGAGKDWLPAELAERLRVRRERLAEFRGRL